MLASLLTLQYRRTRAKFVVCGFYFLFMRATCCTAFPRSSRTPPRIASQLNVATVREADYAEEMVGGQRYSMIQLPDSMVCILVADKIIRAIKLFLTLNAIAFFPLSDPNNSLCREPVRIRSGWRSF
jgi:hypothetical protein